jgi:hypothetical protein
VADPASLSNLRDIVEPAGNIWWPPAPGQVLLAVLILLWALVAILRWRQHRRQNAYRREALRELASIQGSLLNPQNRADGLRRLSVLLKRVALAAYPRAEVAALTGEGWTAFLDRTAGRDLFKDGPDRALTAAVAAPQPGADVTSADCQHLVSAARRWIATHRVDAPADSDRAGG